MSLEVLQPQSSIRFQPLPGPGGMEGSPDSSGTGSTDDGMAGGCSGHDPAQSRLDRIEAALKPLLDQVLNGDFNDSAPGSGNASSAGQPQGSGQSPGSSQGGNGLDPQIAEMFAYMARMFEAMMQARQNSQDADDDGVSGVGGAGAPSGGAAPAMGAPGGGAPAGAGGAPAGAGGSPAGAGGTPSPVAPAGVAPAGTAAPAPAAVGGDSPASPHGGSAPGLHNNAGGVPQAAAISGVAPGSDHVVSTGPGADKTFNVTNDTDKPESFTYSVRGVNKATITEAPGKTGTIEAPFGDIGSRISPSDASGNTHPNELLYEDGNGNADISAVDGKKDFAGAEKKMTVTLSDGDGAGDGDKIRAYQYSTDDAAAMGLAGDQSKTANIVLSNA